MKVKVNKYINSGWYYVWFDVSSFSSEETEKMNQFGTPRIALAIGVGKSQVKIARKIDEIDQQETAGFLSASEAEEYETNILLKMKEAIERVRKHKDTFTSSTEVEI